MHSRHIERPGPIASSSERSHQQQRASTIEWGQPDQTSRPVDRIAGLAIAERLGGKTVECTSGRLGECGPGLLDPAFERRTPRQIEALQKGTGMQSRDALQVAISDRRPELGNVCRKHRRVQSQGNRIGLDYVVPELSTHAVEQLRQRVLGSFLVCVWPQKADQRFAGNAGIAGGEQRQECKPASLGGGGTRRTIDLNSSKRSKPQFCQEILENDARVIAG